MSKKPSSQALLVAASNPKMALLAIAEIGQHTENWVNYTRNFHIANLHLYLVAAREGAKLETDSEVRRMMESDIEVIHKIFQQIEGVQAAMSSLQEEVNGRKAEDLTAEMLKGARG